MKNKEMLGVSLTKTSKFKVQNCQRKLTFHVRTTQKKKQARNQEKPSRNNHTLLDKQKPNSRKSDVDYHKSGGSKLLQNSYICIPILL